MKRAKSICNYQGCNALIEAPGRCEKHQRERSPRRLDSKKTLEDKRFYSGSKWTKTSKDHRKMEPLCRQCRKNGYVTAGVITHHNPDRKILIAKGLDPYDHEYLETICLSCHQKELRKKQF
jgi:5-methylcytosine-specific restriction protein A